MLTVLTCLLLGGVIGAFMMFALRPQEKINRELESQLMEAESRLREYQQEVTQHFVDTSQLINNLTRSYRDVHEHLAASAMKLGNADLSRQIAQAGDGKLLEQPKEPAPEDIKPPTDWAPKVPGKQGTLSESYGLEEDPTEEDETLVIQRHQA
ncbi:YhcB family protein [Simiduia aestuariiviva]|uniref:Z-ring associated protein G n=1 Tax=Simiduia aestuariiviva TaxID=1510459 RepID=A0A839UN46_9GAMM|nr:DUF1043 family protein [Simiduia aestuariiviva]MBB3169143.1 hypothetical protein [Simiduia aestuariiviva]